MDLSSTVRTDALPAVATVVAPGAAALLPYVWASLVSSPDLAVYLSAHDGTATLVAVVLSVAAGFVIESIGSYVEVYGIDRRRQDHAELSNTWKEYLLLEWEREPVGQRYLRRLLVTFKFELNACVAALLSLPGIAWLAAQGSISCSNALRVVVCIVVVALLLYVAARGSAGVLADVRQRLVAAHRKQENA
jgi:hypothetical protein